MHSLCALAYSQIKSTGQKSDDIPTGALAHEGKTATVVPAKNEGQLFITSICLNKNSGKRLTMTL